MAAHAAGGGVVSWFGEMRVKATWRAARHQLRAAARWRGARIAAYLAALRSCGGVAWHALRCDDAISFNRLRSAALRTASRLLRIVAYGVKGDAWGSGSAQQHR